MAFVLTRPTSGGSSSGIGIPGMTITIINGQPVLTLEDTTRGNKILSVAEVPVVYAENSLKHNDWLEIGNANNADSAYIATFDGTIVSATAQCENVNGNDKNIHLIINNVDQGAIGSLIGPTLDTFINTVIDIDFNQADSLRLQARDGITGKIEDTVVKLVLKWRG